jgi:hypothetical protein
MGELEHPTEWPEAAKAALTRKIGPLHVWGWLAIIAGGGVAIYFVHKGTLKLPTSSSTTAAATNPVATAVAGGTAGNYGTGGGSSSSGVSSAPAPTPDQTAAGGVADTPAATSGMDAIPGYTSVSTADQAYWASKVDPNGTTIADTYDPATLLARWLQRAQLGTTGTALTQQDINTGMAYATARANAAGVTPDQLATAQAGIAGPNGISYGYNDPSVNAFSDALAKVGITNAKPANVAQQNYINAMPGGFTVANIAAAGNDPKFKAL